MAHTKQIKVAVDINDAIGWLGLSTGSKLNDATGRRKKLRDSRIWTDFGAFREFPHGVFLSVGQVIAGVMPACQQQHAPDKVRCRDAYGSLALTEDSISLSDQRYCQS